TAEFALKLDGEGFPGASPRADESQRQLSHPLGSLFGQRSHAIGASRPALKVGLPKTSRTARDQQPVDPRVEPAEVSGKPEPALLEIRLIAVGAARPLRRNRLHSRK